MRVTARDRRVTDITALYHVECYNAWHFAAHGRYPRLRVRLGGQAGYQGGFIEHYVTGTLYPEGLTREAQLVLGVAAVTVNLVVYAVVAEGRRAKGKSAEGAGRPRGP